MWNNSQHKNGECCKWVGHLACLSRWERLRIAVLGRNGGSEEVGLKLCLSGHLQLQVTKKKEPIKLT